MVGDGRIGLLTGPARGEASATAPFVLAAVVVACLLFGCGKQGPEAPTASSDAGFADDTLPSGSSLARARRGLPPEEDGILKDVRFGVDSYDLGPDAREVLARNADWLKSNPGVRVEIEGHGDDRGTIEYNLALGARRAKAVQDYLSTIGIPAGRMSTISYGEELPVCREATTQCWQRNRRAHFVLLSQ
jgi:peptidoglycan-associated lipoprotein